MIPIRQGFFLGLFLCISSVTIASAQDAPPAGKAKEPSGIPERFGPGEDYRNFFKKPTNVQEFWSAIQFELEVGRLDNAANLMRGLLSLPPTDEDLVNLHEQEGIGPFLKLRSINTWVPVPSIDEAGYKARIEQARQKQEVEKASNLREELQNLKNARINAIRINQQAIKDADELAKKMSGAIKKKYSDPERINKYVKNLAGTPEERDFAIRELYKSGPVAVPYLLGELRNPTDESRVAILQALSQMGSEINPALIAALDSEDPRIVNDLIELLVRRNAENLTPSLWYLATSKTAPKEIRQKAEETLKLVYGDKIKDAPPAKVTLAREANKYYQHQFPFSDPNASPLWAWNGQELTYNKVPSSKIEEYNGVKWANRALKLDPTYESAQVTLLSLLVDKAYTNAPLTRPLAQIAPDVHQVISTTRPELLGKVLDRAMSERRIPVIVSMIRALGQLAEIKALRPNGVGGSTLVNALNHPDKRVQFAAAEAIVNIPGSASAGQTSRIVEIFNRAIAADMEGQGSPRVMVSYFHADLGHQVMMAVRQAGFDPIRAATGRELIRRLNKASDIDAIIMEETLPDPELPYLLTQLRADRNAGQIPIILTTGPEREECLRQAVANYPNVQVVLTGYVLNPEEIPQLLVQRQASNQYPALSMQETHEYAEKAISYLAKMAAGNPAGYDIRSTEKAVATAMLNGRLSPQAQMGAVEILSAIPTPYSQNQLANIIRDERALPLARGFAANNLVKHLQKHGNLLSKEVLRQIEALRIRPDLDPVFRASLALVIGALRPDSVTAGDRLLQITPKVPQAPPLPPLPKDGEEKIKEGGKPEKEMQEKGDKAEDKELPKKEKEEKDQ